MEAVFTQAATEIYVEINGTRIAGLTDCTVRTKKERRLSYAMGENDPISNQPYRTVYNLELSRFLLAQEEIDLYDLTNFNVIITKPECKIIFTGCEWEELNEQIQSEVMENMKITATSRKKVPLESP